MRAQFIYFTVLMLTCSAQCALLQRTPDVCKVYDKKKVTLAKGVPSCDLRLEGVDRQAAPTLVGGLDGVYKLESCMNGKPLYRRQRSPKGQERVLFFSKLFGDWDISNGTRPNEQDILMYGEALGDELRTPLEVERWLMGKDLVLKRQDSSTLSTSDYQPISGRFKCTMPKTTPDAKPTPVAQSQHGGPAAVGLPSTRPTHRSTVLPAPLPSPKLKAEAGPK